MTIDIKSAVKRTPNNDEWNKLTWFRIQEEKNEEEEEFQRMCSHFVLDEKKRKDEIERMLSRYEITPLNGSKTARGEKT
jgi:hypothetical protein